MTQGCEGLVDALQRAGPGVLSLGELTRELNSGSPGHEWSDTGVRQVVHDSGSRVRILDISVDPREGGGDQLLLDSWVLATEARDAPDQDLMFRAIWEALSALAREVEPASRVSVSRWILKAAEARALFKLFRERGPPPTNPHLRPRPLASTSAPPKRPTLRCAAP